MPGLIFIYNEINHMNYSPNLSKTQSLRILFHSLKHFWENGTMCAYRPFTMSLAHLQSKA